MENGSRVRVLYVGGHTYNRQVANALLKASNIDVLFVDSCPETIFWAATQNFHAFMFDGQFSTSDGLGLCRALRSKHPANPIVFFGSIAQPFEIEQALASGATAYLVKPHLDELPDVINRQLMRRTV